MRIVGKKEFYKLKEGIIFSNYTPCVFEGLYVKRDTIYNDNFKPTDFFYEPLTANVDYDDSGEFFDILDSSEKTQSSFGLDFNCGQREGLFDDESLYAIYERDDLDGFIEKLIECRKEVWG